MMNRLKNTGAGGIQLLGPWLTAVTLRGTLLSCYSHLLLGVFYFGHLTLGCIFCSHCSAHLAPSSFFLYKNQLQLKCGCRRLTEDGGQCAEKSPTKTLPFWAMAKDLGLRFRVRIRVRTGLQLRMGRRCCWRMLSLLSIFWQVIHRLPLIFDEKKWMVQSLGKVEQGQAIS